MAVMRQLYAFYKEMSKDTYDMEQGATHARQCCLLYRQLRDEALNSGHEWSWRIKPKMHLWLEMAEFQGRESGNPRRFSAYQDEDFVGFIASIARSRGGRREIATLASNVIKRLLRLCSCRRLQFCFFQENTNTKAM